jgi:hypothetical protein
LEGLESVCLDQTVVVVMVVERNIEVGMVVVVVGTLGKELELVSFCFVLFFFLLTILQKKKKEVMKSLHFPQRTYKTLLCFYILGLICDGD